MRYSQWWREKAPTDLVDRHECTAFQVMLGRHWRLLVIDLDGQAAVGGGSRTTADGPAGVDHAFRRRWSSPLVSASRALRQTVAESGVDRWRKHSAAERLCDGSLIAALAVGASENRQALPVSFQALTHRSLPMPAPAASWLLHIPTITPTVAVQPVQVEPINVVPFSAAPQDGRHRRGDPGTRSGSRRPGRAIHRAENAERVARMPRDFTAG